MRSSNMSVINARRRNILRVFNFLFSPFCAISREAQKKKEQKKKKKKREREKKGIYSHLSAALDILG
jgi:hypothetical protein